MNTLPLAPGDRVQHVVSTGCHGAEFRTGHLAHVYDDARHARVDWEDGGFSVVYLAHLQFCPNQDEIARLCAQIRQELGHVF